MTPYDINALVERLRGLADPQYAAFSEGLIPGAAHTSLGVRTPQLRAAAREILRGDDWCEFLEASRDHPILEIRMLHGFVLGGARCPIGEKLGLTDRFLPFVDNWAVCDGFCASFKPRKDEREQTFAFACRCAASDVEFRKRFGLVLLMSRFREPPYLEGTMAVYRSFRHDGYYARMGAAWGLATLWLSARDAALAILKDGCWDDFTHNKAIQKLCESYRVSPEDKALVRSMRRRRVTDP